MKTIKHIFQHYLMIYPSYWIACGVMKLYVWAWDDSDAWERDTYQHRKIIWEARQLCYRIKRVISERP